MRLASLAVVAILALAHSAPAQPNAAAARDGRHVFDGEHGTWSTHVRRLQRPLSGAGTWVEYEGTTVVTPLLDGRANVAQLRIAGPAGRIEGDDTQCEKRIRVRFDIRRAGADAWRFEQSFSADGGRTWEVNWVAEDRRLEAPPRTPRG